MFKFLHAADIHLDSPLRGLESYDSAPVDAIRGASRRAFEAMVDLAIEEEVAFVLLAGDLYDGDWKDYNTGLFFTRQMGRLQSAGIRAFVIAGNHDAASKIAKALQPPENVTRFSTRKAESVELVELGVVVHGQSYATEHVTENLAAGFPHAVAGHFNIGLLHTSLDGRPGHAPYAPCSLDELRAKGYQYWALGHVHEREEVSRDPWVVFPGCLQGRHVRETGPKGCVRVTVDEGEVIDVVHHELDVFRWLVCSVDLADVEDEETVLDRARQAIRGELFEAGDKPVAMRIRLEGACPIDLQLRADPERWVQQMRALGVELGDDVWIEKVEICTQSKRDLAEALSSGDAFGGLLREIIGLEVAFGSIPGLPEVISSLKAKIPSEVLSGEGGLAIDDADALREVIADAKELVVSRLLTTEETR